MLQRKGIEYCGGVVAGAIVDRDHFDVRVHLAEGRINGVGDVIALVVARDDDRDQRLAGQGRRRRVFFPRPVAFPVQPEIQATGDPQRRHEQRVEEHEVHQELPGHQKDQAQGQAQYQCQHE